MLAYCTEWNLKRKHLPYDTDGMVIKVNEFAQREKIGYTAKVPKWTKAFKFEAEQGVTKLGDVVFHVGKFGELTPVATFDPPVELAGTTVTHASMHNASWVAEKDVRIGDTVRRRKEGRDHSASGRCGDIRPEGDREGHRLAGQVSEVRRTGGEGRDGQQLQLRLREHGPLSRRSSPSVSKGIARKTRMEIDSTRRGNRDSTRRVGAREVHSRPVPAHQEAVADARQIRRDESPESARRHRREQGSRPVASDCRSEHLHGRREHGRRTGAGVRQPRGHRRRDAGRARARRRASDPKRAQFVREYFDSETGKKLVAELKELGIKTTHDKKAAPAGGLPLAGKTIVVTGTLVNYERDEHRGGHQDTTAANRPAASARRRITCSSATDPGSKLDKAKELGVKIIDETEFRKMIGEV